MPYIINHLNLKIMKTQTMPPGTYYIGDPCYIIAGDDKLKKPFWSNVPLFDKGGKKVEDVFFDYNENVKYLFVFTPEGDGVYYDNKGREYYVDSGTIIVIPDTMLKELADTPLIKKEGRYEIIQKDVPFNASYDYRTGILHIDDLTLKL